MQHYTFTTQTEHQKTQFNFWAPDLDAATLELSDDGEHWQSQPMLQADNGWFTLQTEAPPGTWYRYNIGALSVPDPASRYQPADVHGPSQLMNKTSYQWRAKRWHGRPWHEYVIYELHVGTFTEQGTYQAVREHIADLADLGITAIELMPLSDFPGQRNWGYDGVLPYAPDASYGTPDELKQLIDTCHRYQIAVILDVVFNHFGPEGNYLGQYASPFFTEQYHTPWGAAINLDGEHSDTVREFFIQNLEYWRDEFHIDAFRLDAVHCLYDHSDHPFFEQLNERLNSGERYYPIILENERNQARWLPGPHRQTCCTAQWNDDFHHVAHVLLTGESEGYYQDYQQPLARLGRVLTAGFSYQGERSEHLAAPRGEPTTELQLTAFVNHLQNHDQVGNRALGERLSQLAKPVPMRLMTEIWLLNPAIPMFFMGQEYGEQQPFLFFCDFDEPLASAIRQGRRDEFSSFAAFSAPEQRQTIPDPCDRDTFLRSKLTWQDEQLNAQQMLALHRRLLGIRREWITPYAEHIAVADSHYRFREALLDICWSLSNGQYLSMVINGSDTSQSIALPDNFRLIYSSTALAPGNHALAPFSLVLSLVDHHDLTS